LRYWKTTKFVKDRIDYDGVVAVIKENFWLLKNTYLCIAAGSQFPYIERSEFTMFARRASFLDVHVPQSAIDRLFIAVNVELEN